MSNPATRGPIHLHGSFKTLISWFRCLSRATASGVTRNSGPTAQILLWGSLKIMFILNCSDGFVVKIMFSIAKSLSATKFSGIWLSRSRIIHFVLNNVVSKQSAGPFSAHNFTVYCVHVPIFATWQVCQIVSL